MSGLIGGSVKDPNFAFRFFLIICAGMIGFGVALSWKASYMLASEYQEMPLTKKQSEIRSKNLHKQKLLQQKSLNIDQ